MENNYWILILKQKLDALKTVCKKAFHKAAEATDKFMGNKIADKIMKPKLAADENSRNAEEIIISLEKRNIE